jgi:hypothetical protein
MALAGMFEAATKDTTATTQAAIKKIRDTMF